MRRLILFLFVLLPLAAAGQDALRTIVIDAGHGGKDPGTIWGKIHEKDINLDVALRLGEMMKKDMPDVKVLYTRTTDVLIGLADRAKIANDANADLFVSIHVNATDPTPHPPSGALTLIMGKDSEKGNLDHAMKENDAIFYEDDYTTKYKEYLSGSSEMFIIYSLMQYANIDKSVRLATMLQGHFRRSTPIPDRGVSRRNPLVLWHTTMPGVLVELGFLNNEHDRRVLTSDDGKRKMAAAILAGLREYGHGGVGTAVPQEAVPAEAVAEKPLAAEPAVAREKPAAMVEPAAPERRQTDRGVVYMVQILSSVKKIAPDSRELKEYAGKATERKQNGRYRYFVGGCGTFAEALEMQAGVRRSFPDAFAVAFLGGEPIPVAEARKLTE